MTEKKTFGVTFMYLARRSLMADFHILWFIRSSRGHNQLHKVYRNWSRVLEFVRRRILIIPIGLRRHS